MSKPLEYKLEIYNSESKNECIYSFSSKTVFPPFSEGEALTFRYMGISMNIRIIKIEHMIWETEKLCSFTTMLIREENESF